MINNKVLRVILKWVFIYCSCILLIQLCNPWIIDTTKYLHGINSDLFFNQLIWLVICSIVGIYCYSKRIINLNTSSLILAVYSTFKFYEKLHPEWSFMKYGSIYYLDILVIVLFITGVFNSINDFYYVVKKSYEQLMEKKEKTDKKENKSSAIYSDNSIPSKEDDRFEFYEEAELFLNKLEEQKKTYQDNALIVGLEGEWGSGKSFFIDMIKYAIINNKSSQFKLVKFSSWSYRNSNQLTIELLSEISEAIDVKEITMAIDKYIKVFEGTSLQWLANLTKVFCGGDKTAQESFNNVNEKLKNIPQTLIIAIDDIDRLVKEEVLEVLKLVRNTANFRNIVYIVAYDKGYVEETLKHCGINNPEKYLEKIFNVPFLLPEKNINIRKELYKEILRKNVLFNQTDKTDKGIENFVEEFGGYISIRNIKKLAKQLRINTPFVREDGLTFELDIYDTLILYYLSIKYKKMYKKLRDYSYNINKLSRYNKELVYCNGGYVFINIFDEEDENSDIKHFEKNKIEPLVGKNDAFFVSELFKGLFGFSNKKYEKTGYCISNADIYPIFFTKKIPANYVRTSDFVNASKKDSFKEKLKEWNNNTNHSILGWVISCLKYEDYTKEEFILMFKTIISEVILKEYWTIKSANPPTDKTLYAIPGIDYRYNWESEEYLAIIKTVLENTEFNETFSQRFTLLIQYDMYKIIYRDNKNIYIETCEKYLDVYLSQNNSFDRFNNDFWSIIGYLYEFANMYDYIINMQNKCKTHILKNISSFAENWSLEINNDYLSCVFSTPEMINSNFNGRWKKDFFEFIEYHKDEIGEKNLSVFYDNRII